MFLGEIFQIQTQTINGWPDPSHKKLTRPDLGQKFWPGPITTLLWLIECSDGYGSGRINFLGLRLGRVSLVIYGLGLENFLYNIKFFHFFPFIV